MTAPDAALEVIRALEAMDVAYMIVGSLSSNMWGNPRSTRDADFVVEMGLDRINELADRLGRDFVFDRQLGFETITGTQRYQFEVKGTHYKIEVFFLTDDAFGKSRFARRRRVDFEGVATWMPTPEDVVVQKLRWHRPKDVEDAAAVIKVQSAFLDWPYIEKWCGHFGVTDLLNEVRARPSG